VVKSGLSVRSIPEGRLKVKDQEICFASLRALTLASGLFLGQFIPVEVIDPENDFNC